MTRKRAPYKTYTREFKTLGVRPLISRNADYLKIYLWATLLWVRADL